MYSHVLGQAYNYGQSFVPGKDSAAVSTPASPTSFLDRQINTYGTPRRRSQQPQQPAQGAPGAPQPASGVVMPNGVPSVAPAVTAAPQQPQMSQNPGSVTAEGVYRPGQYNGPTYQAQQISQFQAPQFGGMQQQAQGLVQQLLANPQSLSPQVLAQMKGQSADQAAILQRQSANQLKAGLAARGINANSGYGLGQQRALMADTNSNLLNSLRGLDITAAQTGRQDQLNALNAANQFQNLGFQQALGGYQAALQGMDANRNEQQLAIQSALQNWNTNQQAQQLASQSQLAANSNSNQAQSIQNQMRQFGENLGFQREQFDFGKQQQAEQMAAAERARGQQQANWEDQMAFQYQQANQSQWNSLLDYLMGGGNSTGVLF